MNYQETVDYLYSALPMFSREGVSAFKKDLDNTLDLCSFLDNPHQKFKSIHIAGTNGKGSTSHMLAAIFQTAGYKTGLYTSPHLKDFRERIKVNGQPCEEQFVIDFTQRIQSRIKAISPSFFEITVAMAFDYFALQQVDIAIIEVGLGGRIDSTNIIRPELSIITNIGWDHMNLLGNSLESIAFEKSGIIKHQTPVVIGASLPQTAPVFEEKARVEDAPIRWAEQERWVADFTIQPHLLHAIVANRAHDERIGYDLDLTGYYQIKNLLTVLAAVDILRQQHWKLDQQIVKKALAHVKRLTGLHGRWELIQEHPMLVLDVGHNEDGIKQIIRQIELVAADHVHIVIGMVKDKEIDKVLRLLPKNASYYFTRAAIPRALDEKLLQQKAAMEGLQGNAFGSVNQAVEHALSRAHKNDLVLVCGSVFVVGEVNR